MTVTNHNYCYDDDDGSLKEFTIYYIYLFFAKIFGYICVYIGHRTDRLKSPLGYIDPALNDIWDPDCWLESNKQPCSVVVMYSTSSTERLRGPPSHVSSEQPTTDRDTDTAMNRTRHQHHQHRHHHHHHHLNIHHQQQQSRDRRRDADRRRVERHEGPTTSRSSDQLRVINCSTGLLSIYQSI